LVGKAQSVSHAGERTGEKKCLDEIDLEPYGLAEVVKA
jgi:hypothetical protein